VHVPDADIGMDGLGGLGRGHGYPYDAHKALYDNRAHSY
jgi:hypothetical protein